MAEQRVRLTETERLALDFMIAALREGDQGTARLTFEGQESEFIGAIIGGVARITGQVVNATRDACPVLVQTARLATNFIGGGQAALSDPRVTSELNRLRDRSLEELLEELRSGGSQSGFSSRQGAGNLDQLSTQELFEELRRRTS